MVKKYCLDTNILIEAWNKHYSMELCPDYWAILDKLAKEGKVFCTGEVKKEIEKMDDSLKEWIKDKAYLFKEPDEEVAKILKTIFQNKSNERLVDSLRFRSMADPWVIAHAIAEKAVVVTKEGFETSKTKRIKIPNVCASMNVPCIDEFQFLQEIGIRFTAKIG